MAPARGGERAPATPRPGGDGTGRLPHPPSPRAAVAFAAGAGDVALAEQLLQEHRDAVAPWLPARDEPAGPVRWYAGLAPLPGLWRVGAVGTPHRAAEAAVRGARREAEAGSEAGRARFARLAASGAGDASLREVLEWRLALDLALAATWRAAVSCGLRVPDDGRALGGRPFASLPDPYAPLVAIWGLGLSASLSGEVDLVMPAWNVGPP